MGNEVMYQSFEWYLEDDGKFFSKLKDEIKDLKKFWHRCNMATSCF